jgi:hypothetical protein
MGAVRISRERLNKGLVHGWGHVDFLTGDGAG